MHTFRKLAVLLLLFVLLAPLAASAAGAKSGVTHKSAKAERAPASLLSRVWAMASGICMKEGLGIDPSGSLAPAPGSGSQTSNAGLGIDPDGRSGG